MPTRKQIERSKRRNRERQATPLRKAETPPLDPERLQREAAVGPRFRHRGNGGPMYGAWGGPEPPAA